MKRLLIFVFMLVLACSSICYCAQQAMQISYQKGHEINRINIQPNMGMTNLADLAMSIGSAWKNSGDLDDKDGLEIDIYDNVNKTIKGYVYYGYDNKSGKWIVAQTPGGDMNINTGDLVMVHIQPHVYGDLVLRNVSFIWQ